MIAPSMTGDPLNLRVPSRLLPVLQRCRVVTGSLLFLISLQTVFKYFPPAQAADFMSTITESLKCTRDERGWAAEMWMINFLEKCGQRIYQEVRGTFFAAWL